MRVLGILSSGFHFTIGACKPQRCGFNLRREILGKLPHQIVTENVILIAFDLIADLDDILKYEKMH